MEWDIEDMEKDGDYQKDLVKKGTKVEKGSLGKDIPEEVEKVDSKPEYKDYRTWKDIPEKERKNYGI